ncbi:MAG: hypothetical protein M3288_06955 [Thermoproteota archaeon]|nr:hypothetical protein [Thermoproteota archaeon]
MKYFTLVVSGILAILLVSVFVTPAYAADLAAALNPAEDTGDASYVGTRTLTLEYPAGSSLAQQLDGQNQRIEFSLNGTATGQNNTGVSDVIAALNRAFVQAHSPVQASQGVVSYSGVLRGGPTSTVISYRVELQPTLERIVLQGGEGGQGGDLVDLEWRGITINEPLIVNAPDVGQINVNYPIGILQALYPSVAQSFENSQAREIFYEPILTFEDFNAPMTTWHVLFDPVGAYGGSVGLEGTGGAQALSVYSLGESSLREGAHGIEEKDATATIDGATVSVHSTTPPPSGQIQIAGYSDHRESGGSWYSIVTAEAPEGAQTSTGGFPIQVLLVLGGMMGAIAIFILFKARK